MLIKILIILASLAGLGVVLYTFMKRPDDERKKHVQDTELGTIDHIRSLLFLDTPLEIFIMGYFGAVALIYGGMVIASAVVPGLSLTVLYLSGTIFLLLGYKAMMEQGILKKMSFWVVLSSILSLAVFVLSLLGLRADSVDLVQLLREAHQYSATIHVLGVVFGLGATVVVDIMFIHFLQNLKISIRQSVILHLLSQMIILGLILLYLSGIALFLTDIEGYSMSSRFLMKMTVVLIATINGGALNLYVTPLMEKISLREEQQGQHEKLKRIAFALGGISIVSWFSAYFLAMIKILEVFPYLTMLIVYLIVLGIAIAGSQIAKKYYERKDAGEPEQKPVRGKYAPDLRKS